METSGTRKSVILSAIAGITLLAAPVLMPDGAFQPALENALIKKIRQKMEAYAAHLPEERLYVKCDKTLFEPGETIWFSVFLRDGATLKPSPKSDIVEVELIGPKGNVERKLSLIARKGLAAGEFALDSAVAGGIYKLRAYTSWMKNEGENNALEKEIQVQEIVMPTLKMKLDFEKKAFGPGDEVIAKVELATNENRPLADHEFRFVCEVSGKKWTEASAKTADDGIHYVRFRLPEKIADPDVLLNVMIPYNGSTESISRSVPVVLNNISLTFYPEGGDLVQGLEGRLAIRAVNEFGKPADIEGEVLTKKGSRVARFSSYHNGMGAFAFVPQAGEVYTARITKPAGIRAEYTIPSALEQGYAMKVDNSRPGEISVDVQSTRQEELSLIAQVRGKAYYTTVVNAMPGVNKMTFSTKDFPAGVAQLTLFDSEGIARAERLVFVNRERQMNVEIRTDKEKYLPREKVSMTIMLKDEKGLPVPGRLSMAVVNDQLLSFADDKSGHILSQLLLQPDLREKVEEPAFYFDRSEKKSAQALDHLLMTSGWRRFTWEKLMEDELPPLNYTGKKAIIAGTVIDGSKNTPVADAVISIAGGRQVQADENGRFRISGLALYQPVSLTFTAEGMQPQIMSVNDYNDRLQVSMYPPDFWQNQWSEQVQLREMVVMNAAPAGAFDNEDFMRHRRVPSKAGGRKMKVAQAQKLAEAERELPAPAVVLQEAKAANGDAVKDKREDRGVLAKARRGAGPRIMPVQGGAGLYYRARVFAAPVYSVAENVERRTDFRSTVYWNPDIEIGYSGKKSLEFYNSDDISSFRIVAEGISGTGLAGRTEKTYFTQLPFAMSVKMPAGVVVEDLVTIPLLLKNNTQRPIGGELNVSAPPCFRELGKMNSVQTLMPGESKLLNLEYRVTQAAIDQEFSVAFHACGLSDAFSVRLSSVPRGFPASASFSGRELEREYTFTADHLVDGSLKASFTAFPNVVSDLLTGVEGILQEPYGCFEQTSCTAYPNAMVLNYLKETGSNDSRLLAHAGGLLDRGYKRLTTFESPGKGYEWFGANPAHEGLTAYGIMEFNDMKKAGQAVDETMMDRTLQWLLAHRDGKGGFQREKRALHDFGRISDEVMNAYIVYALAESGCGSIDREFEAAYSNAMNKEDAYLLALVSNAAYPLNKAAKGRKALDKLLTLRHREGSFTGSSHSITYSQGRSLTIETTALAIMAMLKSPEKEMSAMNEAVQYLVSSRSGSGVFSSTQGTILALKALTEYAAFSKRAAEDGGFSIYVDGKKVDERRYRAGDRGTIVVEDLAKHLKGAGEHRLKVKFHDTREALPYTFAVSWNTTLPQSQAECALGLETNIAAKEVKVGETVRFTLKMMNRKDEGLPSSMLIAGIPAGLSVQPWQLKELQEKKVFDYYEIKGNTLACYYRGLAPKALKEIHLDLKAEIAGSYEAPASCAYLYYTNEFKTWCEGSRIKVSVK